MTPGAGASWLVVAALAAMTAVGIGAQAAPATEVAVKAAFLFNFAKFTDWTGHAAAGSIALCVVGDGDIAAALAETVGGQRIGSLAVTVKEIAGGQAVRACDVLFLPAAESRRTEAVLESVRGLPVLTVGDGRGFARRGGIIELFIESDRLRFAVNTDAAARSGVRLSSRLLSLARIVRQADGS